MGCTECCIGYYSDNFECKKCPESKLILVLCFAVLLLIIVAILSSTLTFPPLVAVAKGMKLILSGLQAFSCIRLMASLSSSSDGVLSGVNWPPIILSTFEFMNTFTFSFDSLRPQCSIDISPLHKLILMAMGPCFVAVVILLMAASYSLWKIRQICSFLKYSKLISDETLNHLNIFYSVAHCFVVSTLCLKYSRGNQIAYGPLWPALDPRIIDRSDLSVIFTRRRQSLAASDDDKCLSQSDQLLKLPRAWRNVVQDFKDSGVSNVMEQSTSMARVLISSSFSVFIFTFQGVIETMLSTWDCKVIENRKFLRSRPNVECSGTEDNLYSSMITVSCCGLVFYTLTLPLCVALVVRSRWAKETFSHNYVVYDHLFGFITSQYTSAFVSWEVINCIKKILLVAIPMVISTSPVTQSLSNVVLFLSYAMLLIALRPMNSSYLNQIEILNCFNIIVSSFAALLFTVQYENEYILKGSSRDQAGVALVVFIFSAFILSLRLIYVEFKRLFALHSNPFLSKWLRIICSKSGSSIVLGKYLPISLLFMNKTSSKAIQRQIDVCVKRKQQAISSVHKTWNLSSSLLGYLVFVWTKLKLAVQEMRYTSSYEVDENISNKAVTEPDYEFFMWMHKLQQRVLSWSRNEKELRHTEFLGLPKTFRSHYGKSDPPVAVCDTLLRTTLALDEILCPDHQKLLLAFMLGAGKNFRPNLDNGKSEEYWQIMSSMVSIFKQKLAEFDSTCEIFRDVAEEAMSREVCRPFRQKIYGASESDSIKVLERIASTTLPEYCQLHAAKSTVPSRDSSQFIPQPDKRIVATGNTNGALGNFDECPRDGLSRSSESRYVQRRNPLMKVLKDQTKLSSCEDFEEKSMFNQRAKNMIQPVPRRPTVNSVSLTCNETSCKNNEHSIIDASIQACSPKAASKQTLPMIYPTPSKSPQRHNALKEIVIERSDLLDTSCVPNVKLKSRMQDGNARMSSNCVLELASITVKSNTNHNHSTQSAKTSSHVTSNSRLALKNGIFTAMSEPSHNSKGSPKQLAAPSGAHLSSKASAYSDKMVDGEANRFPRRPLDGLNYTTSSALSSTDHSRINTSQITSEASAAGKPNCRPKSTNQTKQI
jgi:hypothetical protein